MTEGEAMSDDQQVLRVFLNETREKADAITSQSHVSAEIKSVVKDLLQICDNFSDLMAQSSGMSADARVLKKKHDQLKIDMRTVETRLEAAKKLFLSIIEEIKGINAEVVALAKKHEGNPGAAELLCASRIKAHTQKMVEIIVNSAK